MCAKVRMGDIYLTLSKGISHRCQKIRHFLLLKTIKYKTWAMALILYFNMFILFFFSIPRTRMKEVSTGEGNSIQNFALNAYDEWWGWLKRLPLLGQVWLLLKKRIESFGVYRKTGRNHRQWSYPYITPGALWASMRRIADSNWNYILIWAIMIKWFYEKKFSAISKE